MIKISTTRKKIDLNAMLNKVVNDVAKDAFEEVKKNTPVDSGRAKSGWTKNGDGKRVIISNPVPYITELNKGVSSQAPNGIVKPAIDAIINKAKSGKYKMEKGK